MIAISVTNYNDINLAKAFLNAYDSSSEIYIHFSSNSWIEMYGEINCKYGSDTEYFIMHAKNFRLFVTFSAPPNSAQKYNYLLVSFFNEIGIETVEIQHGLFQYGVNNLDDTKRCGFDCDNGGWGLQIDYPAKNIISWNCNEAIGYLKSDSYSVQIDSLIDEEYTLIVSNNNWHIYDEYDKFTFISCIVKLVERNSDDLFVWKPHPAELNSEVIKVIEQYNFKNLKIIGKNYIVDYPAEKLIKNCKFGISMVSTALIDFDFESKPTLLYKRPIVEKLIKQLSRSENFNSNEELLKKYQSMKLNPLSYMLKSGVKKLNRSKLTSLIDSLLDKSQPVKNTRVVLEYLDRLAYIRYPDPHKYVVERDFRSKEMTHDASRSIKSMLFNNINSTFTIEELLRSIENRIRIHSGKGAMSVQEVNDLLVKLDNVQNKFHDYQKSTLAYKFKKLFKGWKR